MLWPAAAEFRLTAPAVIPLTTSLRFGSLPLPPWRLRRGGCAARRRRAALFRAPSWCRRTGTFPARRAPPFTTGGTVPISRAVPVAVRCFGAKRLFGANSTSGTIRVIGPRRTIRPCGPSAIVRARDVASDPSNWAGLALRPGRSSSTLAGKARPVTGGEAAWGRARCRGRRDRAPARRRRGAGCCSPAAGARG